MRFVFLLTVIFLAACNSSSSSSRSGNAPASAAPESPAPDVISRSAVPSGAPPAAFGQEPVLRTNPSWPFKEGAPRTSGTGRYANGAFYWTDFVYDAHGALGPNPPIYRVGTPSGGSYHYPEPDQAGNGADIFRVGIGADSQNSYWRVDWQTMLATEVPIAAFALDYHSGGDDEIPGAGVTAPGIDAVVLLSSAGVTVDFKDGNGPVAIGEFKSDLASRSFVAILPKSLFPIDTQPWTIYLVSGIHDGNGGFLDDNAAFRKLPTQPPVFNAAFRDYEDEASLNNFWFDQQQATALNQRDISEFSIELDWTRLGETEPEPLVKGYSNRWYVSSLSGEALKDGGQAAGIDRAENPVNQPQYYDQVQPYGFYLPESYREDPANPTVFTWLLHSLTQNHNQYSATVPNFLDGACERLRQSICATTLGRGPAGGYNGAAEVDFWEVWRDIAQHFTIDSERTISSGYSMGAIGTINLMIKYPEVFAGGVVLAGSHADSPLLPCSPGSSGCAEPKGPELLQNLKWNGYYHAHGSFDQLVPFADARATVDAIKDYGYRYVFDHYVAEDHVIWTLKDIAYPAYEEAAKWMVSWLNDVDTRKQRPGNFVYRWEPSAIDERLGVGPQGAWWLSEIKAIDNVDFAQVSVNSGAIGEADIVAVPGSPEFLPPNQKTLSPALRDSQAWQLNDPLPLNGRVSVDLKNVAALSLNLADAGVADRADKQVVMTSDSPVMLTLTALSNGTLVSSSSIREVVSEGRVTLALPAGVDQIINFSQ